MTGKLKLRKYQFNTVTISGSKNSSLPIIAGSILCDEQVILNNVPDISDVHLLISILKNMGIDIVFKNNNVIYKPSFVKQKYFNYNSIKKLRGSYYIMGALIGKTNDIHFSFLYPGGCKFSTRPINYHLQAFKNMGIKIKANNKKINFKGNKHAATHNLPFPSVGATINIILASSKIEATTYINNASIEPEVIDLCNFLISMGANIKISNRTITINGKKEFKKTNYEIMEDRIEAGTFLILGALHDGIQINNVNPKNLEPLIDLLKQIGFNIKSEYNTITLYNKKESLLPFNLEINPFPSFPTDLGPLICVLASQINGISNIIDKVYKDRISHINELQKFNINITNYDNIITIKGINKINNCTACALDLRCGAALIIAASLSNEYSIITNVENILRGYEKLSEKLNSLGIEFSY